MLFAYSIQPEEYPAYPKQELLAAFEHYFTFTTILDRRQTYTNSQNFTPNPHPPFTTHLFIPESLYKPASILTYQHDQFLTILFSETIDDTALDRPSHRRHVTLYFFLKCFAISHLIPTRAGLVTLLDCSGLNLSSPLAKADSYTSTKAPLAISS